MDRLSRDTKWNLVVAVLVLSSAVTAHLAGTPWRTVGVVLGETVLLGLVLAGRVLWITRSRQHRAEQDRTAPVPARPVLPIRAAGERAT
jgi:uncharacterized iron-regulated membrane protein